jgi:Secretion system C-terminal sorting domain/FG-GAP-like repeat
MTKTILLACLLILIFNVKKGNSQISFSEHKISGFSQGVEVCSIDINKDGYVDLITTDFFGNVSLWGNNTDLTFTKRNIGSNFEIPRNVIAKDINNDSFIDIIVASPRDNMIVWFKNDGSENFSEIVIDNDFTGAHTADIKDINNDGHLDILCSGSDMNKIDGKIGWWENNGDETFTRHIVSDRFKKSTFIFGEDIDNDNDIDLLACGEINDEILWYENIGENNFTEHMIDGNFDAAHTVFARDLDKDGDIDILGAACASPNSHIAWWENNGNQSFTKRYISRLAGALWLDTVDINNDGFLDLVSAAYAEGIVLWLNDGNQNFERYNIKTNERCYNFTICDIDNDGSMDIVTAGSLSNRLIWFENNLVISSNRNNFQQKNDLIDVFPNPAKNNINIKSEIYPSQMSIYDFSGREIINKKVMNNNQNIDISNLKEGIYFLKITGNNKTAKRIFVKN